MFKAWHKSNMFLRVQSTQTSRVDNVCFFQMSFFLPNVQHSFWKLEKILRLMIKKENWLETEFFLITHLNTFALKTLLTLKIMDLKKWL
jgi:hypothetical protein